jgi:hypothetical protein
MKLYWFSNLVQYYPSWDTPYMKYDVTHILTSLKNDVKVRKRTSRDTENENKRGKFILVQLDVVFKKNQWLNP